MSFSGAGGRPHSDLTSPGSLRPQYHRYLAVLALACPVRPAGGACAAIASQFELEGRNRGAGPKGSRLEEKLRQAHGSSDAFSATSHPYSDPITPAYSRSPPKERNNNQKPYVGRWARSRRGRLALYCAIPAVRG